MIIASWLDGGNANLQDDLMRFTEINHFQNPFVSTTSSIQRAYKYATSSYEDLKGYISVIRLPKQRFLQFRVHLDIESTKIENEYGVIGLILEEELVYQIPVEELGFIPRSADLTNKELYQRLSEEFFNDTYRYNPANPSGSLCPHCNEGLGPYVYEVLGDKAESLQIVELSKPDWNMDNRHVKPSLTPTELKLMSLVYFGMIVRCRNCGKYICNPKTIFSAREIDPVLDD